MGRRVIVGAVAASTVLVGLVAGAALGPASAAAPAGASAFVPLGPTRIVDTRAGLGGTTIADDGSIDVQIAGVGGVPPTGVVAVAMNLTATDATQPGFVTAWPTGSVRPVVSNLNVEHVGETIANVAVVPLGAAGKVSFYAFKQLDLVVDVAGYWVEAAVASAGRYVAAGPARILDTRSGNGAPAAPVPDDGTITLLVRGRGDVPPIGAAAVILNVTATEATGPGFVTVWPAGAPRPSTSNLNVEHAGQTIANLVIVPLGTGGSVSLYALKSVHLVADVLGFLTDRNAVVADSGLFVPVAPQRILDTRTLAQNGGIYASELPGDTRADLQVLGRANVPIVGVAAVVANVTAADATAPGFVTVYPAATNRPTTSDLNVEHPGQTIPNLVVGRIGYQGRVSLYAMTNLQLLVDVAGWFTGDLTAPDSGVPLTPPPVAG